MASFNIGKRIPKRIAHRKGCSITGTKYLLIACLGFRYIASGAEIKSVGLFPCCTFYTSTFFNCCSGYLVPLVSKLSITTLSSASSSSVNLTSRDAQFSSRRGIVFVPGIGMISGPCAATHASASCAGVMLFFVAIEVNFSTICEDARAMKDVSQR